MIDFLLGVPGKLKAISDHLTTYWTSTRAAKLDLLTVAPAPASTALSNATWTGALATLLGNTIQTSIIASIQHRSSSGTSSSPVNTTITSVNTAKSIVFLRNYRTSTTTTGVEYVELTSSTNVRTYHSATGTTTVHWTVVEFK